MTNSLEQISQITGPQLLQKADPLVILFSTSWCGECMIIESMLCKLKKELKIDIPIFKVDAEKESNIKKFFGVHYLPTIITISNSKVVNTFSGVTSKQAIHHHLDRLWHQTGITATQKEQLHVRQE